MNSKPRTPREIAYLRRHAATQSVRELARALGRDRTTIHRWCKALGITRPLFRQPWKPAEDQVLRSEYGITPIKVLMGRLQRGQTAIWHRAKKLRLTHFRQPWTKAETARMLALHHKGMLPRHIAEVLGRNRQVVARKLQRLGVAPNRDYAASPLWRERNAQCRERQKAQLGVNCPNELRTLGFRRFAQAQGWPADLRPRAVQILDALHYYGPQTRRELCARLGLPWKGSRASLKSNDPEGSYLANLIRRGLVVYLGRCVKGQSKGSACGLYTLALSVQKGDPSTWAS